MEIKKLKRTKGKHHNDKKLEEFEKLMSRDKTKDIIVGNPFYKNEQFQKEMFVNMFYDKMRDFFSDYLLRMNKDEKLYLDEKKRIEIKKMF